MGSRARSFGAPLVVLVVALVAAAAATPATVTATVRVGWPCPGCETIVPAAAHGSAPRPLLVALHGDEGSPDTIAATLAPAAEKLGMIVLAPQCPTALGCRFTTTGGTTNSWWGWLQFSGRYDDGWLGRQIAQVAAAYRVDAGRRYLFGWSGGADYLGWYALRHAADFAGAAFVAGGVPYVRSCPAKPLPGFFLDGAADPRYLSGQPASVRQTLASCRARTELVVLPAADHQATLAAVATGWGDRILRWLLHNRRS